MNRNGTMMSNIISKLTNIRKNIERRSAESRSQYLRLIDDWKDMSPNTNSMGCSNVAHTYAACNKSSPNAINQPMIGIVSAYNDMLSAHAPFEQYPKILKDHGKDLGLNVQVATGVPAMCDGITQGEPGMELSLFSRDTIALSTAIGLSHNVFNGIVCMGTCDKIVPGLVIGALRHGHLPAIFVSGGPMSTGISNTEKSLSRKEFAAGKIDRIKMLEVEQKAYHDQGTCTFYGTANTNQLIAEAMGFQLPGAAFTPSNGLAREIITKQSLNALSDLIENEVSFGEMLDIKNWLNGMIVLLTSGGSTNLIIHLIAMAKSCGYIITVEDFSDLSKIIPLICKIYPNGEADVNQFHSDGGIARMLANLLEADLIFEDIQTVIGTDLNAYTQVPCLKDDELIWKNKDFEQIGTEIISKPNDPFKSNGGIKFINGEIVSGIMKVSALDEPDQIIEAPAKVFFNQEDIIDAIKSETINQNTILVLLGQSPQHNGMPELHKLTAPINVLQDKGLMIALVTDGRMSGASGSFPALIHANSKNGNLYKIQNEDILRIDLKNEVFEIKSTNIDKLSIRESHNISSSDMGLGRELFSIFREKISSSDSGATIFNFNKE